MTPNNFIRTVTINGKPLVLRFNKVSDTEFAISFVNDRQIDDMRISYGQTEWKIVSGGTEEIRQQEARIVSLMEVQNN